MGKSVASNVYDPQLLTDMITTGPISFVHTSATEREFSNRILAKKVPIYRLAYSDRTAWLMPCLAELAYVRFNPLFKNGAMQSLFDKEIAKLLDRKRLDSIAKLTVTPYRYC